MLQYFCSNCICMNLKSLAFTTPIQSRKYLRNPLNLPQRHMDAHRLYSYQSSNFTPAPSDISAATMSRVTRDELADFLLDSTSTSQKSSSLAGLKQSDLAIVDVRDSDYIGGHIRSCINVPSANLEWKLPELVRQLWDKKVVVFHCALSQQRGPSAAAKYARERERIERQKFAMEDSLAKEDIKDQNDSAESSSPSNEQQKVVILDGGFVRWQEKYGNNQTLTEGYVKDIWEDAFY